MFYIFSHFISQADISKVWQQTQTSNEVIQQRKSISPFKCIHSVYLHFYCWIHLFTFQLGSFCLTYLKCKTFTHPLFLCNRLIVLKKPGVSFWSFSWTLSCLSYGINTINSRFYYKLHTMKSSGLDPVMHFYYNIWFKVMCDL